MYLACGIMQNAGGDAQACRSFDAIMRFLNDNPQRMTYAGRNKSVTIEYMQARSRFSDGIFTKRISFSGKENEQIMKGVYKDYMTGIICETDAGRGREAHVKTDS